MEGSWLSSGYSDNSINGDLVNTIENALDRRRKQIRDTAAPNPLGLTMRLGMHNNNSGCESPRTPRKVTHDDSDLVDEEPDDELASEELSGDDNYGMMTPPVDRSGFLNTDQAYEDEDEDMQTADEEDDDDEGDDDDDDNLTNFL